MAAINDKRCILCGQLAAREIPVGPPPEIAIETHVLISSISKSAIIAFAASLADTPTANGVRP
jgi:hypothetical protein